MHAPGPGGCRKDACCGSEPPRSPLPPRKASDDSLSAPAWACRDAPQGKLESERKYCKVSTASPAESSPQFRHNLDAILILSHSSPSPISQGGSPSTRTHHKLSQVHHSRHPYPYPYPRCITRGPHMPSLAPHQASVHTLRCARVGFARRRGCVCTSGPYRVGRHCCAAHAAARISWFGAGATAPHLTWTAREHRRDPWVSTGPGGWDAHKAGGLRAAHARVQMDKLHPHV
jgi:hypothetical protein